MFITVTAGPVNLKTSWGDVASTSMSRMQFIRAHRWQLPSARVNRHLPGKEATEEFDPSSEREIKIHTTRSLDSSEIFALNKTLSKHQMLVSFQKDLFPGALGKLLPFDWSVLKGVNCGVYRTCAY